MDEQTNDQLEARIRILEQHRAADAKDIAWMRENLTLARSQHNWNIATLVSILSAVVALILSILKLSENGGIK